MFNYFLKKEYQIVFLLIISIVFTNNALQSQSNTQNPHIEFGIPSDSDPSDDYIIERPQYVISYNHQKGSPNWVSWNLERKWYGEVERFSGRFITDKSLPDGFINIKHNDYTHSGYDRGHLVRSEERTATDEDNKSTFIITNIIPQTPDLNRGVWLDLEYHCEDLCKEQNKELYVIAGGIYHSGRTLKDEGKVEIPDECFKIIVVLDKDEGLYDINIDDEIIAVIMPNIEGIRSHDWEQYVTNVDDIESSTGYDFLALIPDNIENKLEADIIDVQIDGEAAPNIKYRPQITPNVEKKVKTKPREEKPKAVQCKGYTKSGSRCKRMTTHPSGYCWQHRPK